MKKLLIISIIAIWAGVSASAQIPVEVFSGNERTTLDIMFFRFFKNKNGENSHWLFFNRNRAGVDYRITSSKHLPVFGFTEAISYNHPKFKGFAPVAVAQVLSWGVYPKAGVQYVAMKESLTIFSWIVSETLRNPTIDFYVLCRYTPPLSEHLNLFCQIESLNAFSTPSEEGNTSLVQRARLGLKIKEWQFGAGADFSQASSSRYILNKNIGAFLRHEF